jgi:hypothetical protein
MTIQDFFDLGRLHSISPDLPPKVLATLVDQASVGTHEAQVAAEIYSLAIATWVGFEFARGELGLAPVPQRKIVASDGYFTDLVGANLVPGIIQ